VCEEDRHSLVELYGADPVRTIVVENGADTERYRPVDRDTKVALKQELGLPAKCTVAFVGSRFPPNTEALSWIHRLARATDRFAFLVVGDVARRSVRGNVVATGRVGDIAPYLQAADAFVCPVQYGGGTKIKLFEALSTGLPTVAFEESLRGTSFVDGEHVLVAGKSERDLLARLDELERDSALAERLGEKARALVVERHDWRRSATALDEALRSLLGEHDRRLTYRSAAGIRRHAAI
jgi:glycosyltransferase involved in cell wall biosynthesis